ncbi:MAG: multimeric flavodoxin WrbA-like protein [Peptococcaceae bacterium BICA1-7]|nr:MAG: multimeric flavodoxin WrbA-like protein [Peptococcaceae bacterium BICA1-7]HBV97095.1 flavodoxin [Desulfotomaculum sp.]
MKKVLGLVISERRLGNTELLLKEILGGVPDPCQREMIRLTEYRIDPCRACYRCLEPGVECRLKDDFNLIIKKIMEADALVIGFPVYFLGPHALFKALTDRLLGAVDYSGQTRGKPCAVVIPYGMPGWEGYTRTSALVLPGVLEMKLVDCWMVHATLPGEGVVTAEKREYARRMGMSLFSGADRPKGPRECPYCGSDLFRLLPGGAVECPLCLARGQVKEDGVPELSVTGHHRFSTGGLQEHFGGWLVEMKKKYLEERERLKEVQKEYRGKGWWVDPRP